jgi:hypothetical protein
MSQDGALRRQTNGTSEQGTTSTRGPRRVVPHHYNYEQGTETVPLPRIIVAVARSGYCYFGVAIRIVCESLLRYG